MMNPSVQKILEGSIKKTQTNGTTPSAPIDSAEQTPTFDQVRTGLIRKGEYKILNTSSNIIFILKENTVGLLLLFQSRIPPFGTDWVLTEIGHNGRKRLPGS